MSSPLRLFLLTRKNDADWSFFVTQTVEEAEAEWVRLQDAGPCNGLLYVGFGRPSARTFNDLFHEQRGQLLASASAKLSFPAAYRFSRHALAEVNGIAIFAVLQGFGFNLEDNVAAPVAHDEPKFGPDGQSGLSLRFEIETKWLQSFLSDRSDLVDVFREAEIFDENSYLKHEVKLPINVRNSVGQFRFDQIIKDRTDPNDIVRCALPWLRRQKLTSLPLTVRLNNVFANKSIIYVADLDLYSEAELFRLKNFGRHSKAHLVEALLEGLRRGAQYENIDEALATEERIFDAPVNEVRDSEEAPLSTGLIGCLMKSLSVAEERDRDILLARMGFWGPPRTLEDIGADYGVTRERIRQIEKRLVTRIAKRELWDDILRFRLRQILSGRSEEVPLYGLEIIDAWFIGTADKEDALQYLIETFGEDEFFVVKVGTIRFVSRINQDKWDEVLRSAQRLLASVVDLGWSESDCEFTVKSLLSEVGNEMASLLWTEASKLCRFSESSGTKMLTAYGRGLEQAVQAVMEESPRPLHTSEVADLVSRSLGRSVEESQVRNSLANVGFLLGRGTYGLRKHVPLTDQDMDEVTRLVSAIISEYKEERQWHASELLEALADADPSFDKLDKYSLNAVLQLRSDLVYLGRLVWAGSKTEKQERIDVFESVVEILHTAGGPLSGAEINERLSKIRGVNSIVQIWNRDPIIRVGRGLWGLNDRDVDVKRDQQVELVDAVFRALYSKRKGIHIDEIFDHIGSKWSLQPEAVFSIVSQDSRISASVGRYLYLTEWGSPRRMTLEAAYKQLSEQIPGPMKFSDIKSWLEFATERSFDRSVVSHLLSRLGSKYLGDSIWDVHHPVSSESTASDLGFEE